MADDWMPVRVALPDNPRVAAIAEKLDIDDDLVVGKLVRVWGWFDQNTPDGHARGVTLRWINRHVRVDGFAEAMRDVGWLEVDADGIVMPDFERYLGQGGKKRVQTARRQAKHRGRKKSREDDAERNAPSHADRHARSNAPSVTESVTQSAPTEHHITISPTQSPRPAVCVPEGDPDPDPDAKASSAAPPLREPDPTPSPSPTTNEPPPGVPDPIGLELLRSAGVGEAKAEEAAATYPRDRIREIVGNTRRGGSGIRSAAAYCLRGLRDGYELEAGARPALTEAEQAEAQRRSHVDRSRQAKADTSRLLAQRNDADAARASADQERQRMRERVATAWSDDRDRVTALLRDLGERGQLPAAKVQAAVRDGPDTLPMVVAVLSAVLDNAGTHTASKEQTAGDRAA